jgi:hypothetical protein
MNNFLQSAILMTALGNEGKGILRNLHESLVPIHEINLLKRSFWKHVQM